MADFDSQETGVPGVTMRSGSSSRTTTSGNNWDNNPEVEQAAISSVTDLTKAGGSIDQAFTDMTDAITRRKTAEAGQIAAMQDYASNVGNMATSKAAVEAAGALRRNNILTVAGINPDDAANAVNGAFATIYETNAKGEVLGQEIERRMSVGMYDNPLEWMVNQTRLPGMVAEYNGLVGQEQRAIAKAKTLQGLAGTQQSLSVSIDADLIAKEGLAVAASTASKAQAELKNKQVELEGSNIRDIANKESLLETKASLAIRLAELLKQKKTEGVAVSEREAAQMAEQLQIDDVNRYLQMIGSTKQYTPTSFKLTLDKKTQTELQNLSGTGVIHRDFAGAAEVISGKGSYTNIEQGGDAAAMNWFKGTMSDAGKQAGLELAQAQENAKLSGKIIDSDAYTANLLNQKQAVYASQGKSNMRSSASTANSVSENNPLAIDYVSVAKAFVPRDTPTDQMGIKKDNLVASYINKYGPTGEQPLFAKADEAQILAAVSKSIQLGTITAGTAATQVAEFYKFGMDYQFDKTKYGLFGMSKPAGYPVIIAENSGSGFSSFTQAGTGTKQKPFLDLTNRAEVEAYLTRDVAKRKAAEAIPELMRLIPL